MVIENQNERVSVPTVLLVEGDAAAVREALSRSGFAVRDEPSGSAVGAGSGTVMAVTPGETVVLSDGLAGDIREREGGGEELSAAAILARAGLSGERLRSSGPPRPVPASW
jgi:hypothetical protein